VTQLRLLTRNCACPLAAYLRSASTPGTRDRLCMTSVLTVPFSASCHSVHLNTVAGLPGDSCINAALSKMIIMKQNVCPRQVSNLGPLAC